MPRLPLRRPMARTAPGRLVIPGERSNSEVCIHCRLAWRIAADGDGGYEWLVIGQTPDSCEHETAGEAVERGLAELQP